MATKYGPRAGFMGEQDGDFRSYITYSTSTSNTEFTITLKCGIQAKYAAMTGTNSGLNLDDLSYKLTHSLTDTKTLKSGTLNTYSISKCSSKQLCSYSHTYSRTTSNRNISYDFYSNVFLDSSLVSVAWTIPALDSYIISYNTQGGTSISSQTKYYGQSLTITSNIPTRMGYTFKGWATSSSSTTVAYNPGSSYTTNSAITLYAIWEVNNYLLTLDNDKNSIINGFWNNNTYSAGNYSIAYNTNIDLSTYSIFNTGYHFGKWIYKYNLISIEDTIFEKNVVKTYYEEYYCLCSEPNIYYINWYKDPKEIPILKQYKYDESQQQELFSKDGYELVGWTDNAEAQLVFEFEEEPTGIVFSATEEVYNWTASNDYTEENPWHLYAIWHRTGYTITIDTDDSTDGNFKIVNLQDKDRTNFYLPNESLKISEDTLEKTGYTRKTKPKWQYSYDQKNWAELKNDISTFSFNNKNVYLKTSWTENSYKIQFEIGEIITQDEKDVVKTKTLNDLTLTYTQVVSLPSAGITVEGHTFDHWNTEIDDTGISYALGEEISKLKTEGSITLYGIVVENIYQLNFSPGEDASGTINSILLYYTEPIQDKLITEVKDFIKRGYTYEKTDEKINWYLSPTTSRITKTSSRLTEGTEATVYPKWNPNNITFIFNLNDSSVRWENAYYNIDNNESQIYTIKNDYDNTLTLNTIAKQLCKKTDITVTEPWRWGYKFKGWQDNVNNILYSESSKNISNIIDQGKIELYAIWEKIYNDAKIDNVQYTRNNNDSSELEIKLNNITHFNWINNNWPFTNDIKITKTYFIITYQQIITTNEETRVIWATYNNHKFKPAYETQTHQYNYFATTSDNNNSIILNPIAARPNIEEVQHNEFKLDDYTFKNNVIDWNDTIYIVDKKEEPLSAEYAFKENQRYEVLLKNIAIVYNNCNKIIEYITWDKNSINAETANFISPAYYILDIRADGHEIGIGTIARDIRPEFEETSDKSTTDVSVYFNNGYIIGAIIDCGSWTNEE